MRFLKVDSAKSFKILSEAHPRAYLVANRIYWKPNPQKSDSVQKAVHFAPEQQLQKYAAGRWAETSNVTVLRLTAIGSNASHFAARQSYFYFPNHPSHISRLPHFQSY